MQQDENRGITIDTVPEEPGVVATDIANAVARDMVEEGKPYLPTASFQQQATTLLVYGMRMDGPIGSLLRVAAHAIEVAILAYEEEYGEWENGDAPDMDVTVDPVKWGVDKPKHRAYCTCGCGGGMNDQT